MDAYPYADLPEHLQDGVRRWLEDGITPGSFLRAVLRNDLFEAVIRADEISYRALAETIRWFINNAPDGSYGSDRVFSNWPMYLRAKKQLEAFSNG